jgi:sulfate/thiosulfate transport system permease protein
MSDAAVEIAGPRPAPRLDVIGARDPNWLRLILIALAIVFGTAFLLAPLAVVAAEAFDKGVPVFWEALSDPDAFAAIRLTLTIALIVVPINTALGVAAAWTVSKFEFKGKTLLLTLLDLPFSVSPVVSGLVFVLVFGSQGLLGPWFASHGIQVIFAIPGMVLATLFVTCPFVARELIPVMQQLGSTEEEAALSLGASGWTTFLTVTLPNVRWALLSGVLLCNARAMGEFGAVSIVSGHIRGLTNTIPLQVEILYNEYNIAAAFALASLLALLALVTLGLKSLLEWRIHGSLR